MVAPAKAPSASFMSFLGQPRRKPINLGNKQHKTREDILKTAENERIARHKNRLHSDAAVVLQAAIRARIGLRKARIKALQRFESKIYMDSNSMILDFIYICPVYYLSANQNKLISTVKDNLQNEFLHSQLLLALNSLWETNSSHLEPIFTLYNGISRYPNGILKPLYDYAVRNPGCHSTFLRDIFNSLVATHPETIFEYTLNSNALQSLEVDLTGLQLQTVSIKRYNIPPSRLYPLLQFFLHCPTHPTAIIVQLVILLPPKLPINIAESLEVLFSSEFVQGIVELNLEPRDLSAFILPLLSVPGILWLLMQLSIVFPELVKYLWSDFKESQLYQSLREPFHSGFVFGYSDRKDDWILLISLLELYSYQLIVSGDAKMFNIIDLEQLLDLSICLKSACALICAGKCRPLHGQFNSTFFAVIKQIYIRSERRKTFPSGFWLITGLIPNYSLENLKKTLTMDYDDDEINEYNDNSDTEISIRHSLFVEALRRIPFFVDFLTRAGMFLQLIADDKSIHRPIYDTIFSEGVKTYPINRDNMVSDTFLAFKELLPDNGIKTKCKFTIFTNGQPEPGIDGGGLTKEVLKSVCEEVFVRKCSPAFSDLFIEAPDHTVYPNPRYRTKALKGETSVAMGEMYFFLGLVIGKCLHEKIIVDVHFSPFFLQKWAGISSAKSSFDDFYLLDPDMYAGLQKLSSHDGNIEDLALDFTIDDGCGNQIELKQNGSSIPVTNENKLEYIHLVSNFWLNDSIRSQTISFLKGVAYFISPGWLNMFSTHEIQTLISGDRDDFDTEDLRKNTELSGFAMDKYVDFFWEVVDEMDAEERQALLKFVTSVPRGPLLGFSTLHPKFALRSAGRTDDRLPTASTCVNLLKLPEYSSKEVLREKLLYAINSNSGFDLS